MKMTNEITRDSKRGLAPVAGCCRLPAERGLDVSGSAGSLSFASVLSWTRSHHAVLCDRVSPSSVVVAKPSRKALRSDNDGPPVNPSRYILPAPTENASAGSEQPARLSIGGRGLLSPGSGVHLRLDDTANWVTPSGVWKKRMLIEKQGLPDFKGRRFITLSLDRELFDYCPLTAYLNGKERLRRFLEAGRKSGLWERSCWWAWKLEFQKDGWAHWHLILDRVKKFSRDEMERIKKIWGLGRTNCRRISKSAFGYQFKYAFKGVFQQADDGEQERLSVPRWFLDYYQPSKPDPANPGEFLPPVSFARARFWQTSKGFYTLERKASKPLPADYEPSFSHLPLPVAQVLENREETVTVIARDRMGNYVESARLRLGVCVKQLVRLHLWGVEHGKGFTLSARSFVMDQIGVNQIIKESEKWKLTHLLAQNLLTLRRAQLLRESRQTLHRY